MQAFRRLASLTCACALAALASCGGGGLSTAPDNSAPLGAWPGHGWDSGARSGAFVAVAVDATERQLDPLTQRLRIERSSDASGELLRIFGSGIDGSSVYLHLKYDERDVHPAETQRGEALSEDVLFLGVTTQPGIVVLGLATVGGVRMTGTESGSTGELELAQVRFAHGSFSNSGALARRASDVSDSVPDDLRFEGDTLRWTYVGAGDYDQNGETNISDLTPIGVHLGHSTSDGQHDGTDAVVDGDGNGLITLAELSTIGANYLERITDYQAQDAAAASGPWILNFGATVAQSAGVIPGGGGFREYSFTVPTPVDGRFYSVQVFDGATGGGRSNSVQYGAGGSFAAPQNTAATDDGAKITVTWEAPATGSPTGYDVYVADNAAMTGAVKMNSSPVAVLTFDCSPIAVPVGDPHYFAVKALYGVDESGYSNIYGYLTGGSGGPTNLSAVLEASQIRLDWDVVVGADSYNCYVGDQSDLSDAQLMHLPGQVTTNTYLCPVAVAIDTEHYFGVKAVTASVESGFSNIVHYTP
ncbi:MAG: hypothetical protein M3R04_07410, partial [bacterium]|nr:hypothetical protein [bacterium]